MTEPHIADQLHAARSAFEEAIANGRVFLQLVGGNLTEEDGVPRLTYPPDLGALQFAQFVSVTNDLGVAGDRLRDTEQRARAYECRGLSSEAD